VLLELNLGSAPVPTCPKDATWEHEDTMQEEYPHHFENF
jgi:hypothetical protein